MLTLKEAASEQEMAHVREIRRKVFAEELGQETADVFSAPDEGSTCAIMYDGKKPVATGRLCFDDERWKICSIAVVIEERGAGLGDFLMRYLIRRAFDSGAGEVYVNALADARGFYEKLGFAAVEPPRENRGAIRVLMKRAGDIGGRCV